MIGVLGMIWNFFSLCNRYSFPILVLAILLLVCFIMVKHFSIWWEVVVIFSGMLVYGGFHISLSSTGSNLSSVDKVKRVINSGKPSLMVVYSNF